MNVSVPLAPGESAQVRRWQAPSARRAQQLLLLAGLCGPGIGAFGLYAAHVALLLTLAWCIYRPKDATLEREHFQLAALGVALLVYVLLWAMLSGGAPWALLHLAMVGLSGAAFLANAALAAYRAAASRVLHWLVGFTWLCMGLAWIEAITGLRLPVSRYSPLAPKLGFAYEGHDGASSIFEALWMPTGMFGNQNNLALMLLCLLPFALAATRRVLPKALLVLSAVGVLIVSESRTALFVGLAWVVAATALALFRRHPLWMLPLAGAAIIALAHAESAIDWLCQGSELKLCVVLDLARMASFEDLALADDSIGVRVSLSEQAWQLWTGAPWFGVGPGHLAQLISAVHSEGAIVTDAHNAVLQALTEYGVAGAALWLLAAAVVFRALLRMPRGEDDVGRFRRAAMIFWTLLPVASVTVSTMYYFVPVWALAGATFGVALGERTALPPGRGGSRA